MVASAPVTVKDRSAFRARLLLGLVLGSAFLPALLDGWRADEPRRFDVPVSPGETSSTPFYVERFIEASPSMRSLHTPALGELANGDLLAVWKVGEDEPGTSRVSLHAATYDRGAGAWGLVRSLTSSRKTQEELGRLVITLANPVLLTGRDGGVSLLYVTTWARWSTAALALKTSTDRGQTWGPARRIVASPAGNLGTLVKTAPVHYTDGSVGVPAYHEFVGVFPQLLRFSPEGELLDKVRIHRGQVALQPSIVPLDAQRALVLMRNARKGRILMTRTSDAGLQWDPVQMTDLPNPNAPVMGVRLRDGAILLVFNNSPRSRERLSLALSRDGGERWTVFHSFEEDIGVNDSPLDNFGYPYLLQASDGVVHIVYPWRLTHVKHVSFNRAWIHLKLR
jgi:BNR repeat-like domain